MTRFRKHEKWSAGPEILETALVAYIDILGYSWLVRKFGRDLETIKDIEAIFETVSGVGEQLRNVATEKMLLDLLPTVEVVFVSDSIIIVANLTQAERIDPAHGKQNSMLTLGGYLSYIATFFTAKTGLLLRGGIAAGPHYENSTQTNRFLFSWAYLRAYELEKQAGMPRIVIDRRVAPEFRASGMDWQDKDYQESVFDLYHLFARPDFVEMAHKILPDVRNAVLGNLDYNKNNPEQLEKILHFIDYHNKRIAQPDLSLQQYAIKISK